MMRQYIEVSPDVVIRIRAYPGPRRRALRALAPKAVGLVLGSVYVLALMMNA